MADHSPRNVLRVSDTGFDDDCRRLVTAVEHVLEQTAAEQREREEKERLETERRETEAAGRTISRGEKNGWSVQRVSYGLHFLGLSVSALVQLGLLSLWTGVKPVDPWVHLYPV
jgi:hypothetical protein